MPWDWDPRFLGHLQVNGPGPHPGRGARTAHDNTETQEECRRPAETAPCPRAEEPGQPASLGPAERSAHPDTEGLARGNPPKGSVWNRPECPTDPTARRPHWVPCREH